MLILDHIPTHLQPHAFTIGTFDGVHLGHQALLRALQETQKPTAVLTFSNHPLETLKGQTPPLLTPIPLKLQFLKQCGVDTTIVLPFDRQLADTPFDHLLERLPLSHLILGTGAAFGQQRLGTQEAVSHWAARKNIPVEYLPKSTLQNETISSRRIREAILSGDLTLAEKLLGRPHALFAPSERFSASTLALPPDGRYRMSCGRIAAIENGWVELNHSSGPTTLFFKTRE